MKRKAIGATPRYWSNVKDSYSVRGLGEPWITPSEAMSRGISIGGVVVYGIRTLRARNGSISSEMASDLSIRAIHDYSDDRFLATLPTFKSPRNIFVLQQQQSFSFHFGHGLSSSSLTSYLPSRIPPGPLHQVSPSPLPLASVEDLIEGEC